MRTPKTYRNQTMNFLAVSRPFSRYMPHQGEQEKMRRVLQGVRKRAKMITRQYVGNTVPTWHMNEHGNVVD